MSDAAIVKTLSEVDLFSGLPDRVVKKIAAEGRTVAFEGGTPVTEEGSSVKGWASFSPNGVCFYVILEGSADVEVHGEHRITLGAGQYFGETSLIDGQPRSATVVAGPDGMKAFSLSAFDFAPILEQNPPVALALLKVLAARLRAAEARG
jgi:CRP/FNR family transcriptional regulator, cyclic AMP receptor protein